MKDINQNPVTPVVQLTDIVKDFSDGRNIRRVIFPLNLSIYPGELTVISGPSGSGKTTILTMMALILKPTEGKIIVNHQDVTSLSENKLATMRLRNFGFVFQTAAMIPALTVMENVLIALAVQGDSVTSAKKIHAEKTLELLGLGDFLSYNIEKLSGGQKQRVAIARALINDPSLILCDEPTSSLDIESSTIVLDTLKALSKENKAVVLVTHDSRVFPYADRLIQVIYGKITADTRNAET
jgi:putative ABC transport system ATP-binding protein